jgi:hypothetical protein
LICGEHLALCKTLLLLLLLLINLSLELVNRLLLLLLLLLTWPLVDACQQPSWQC